MIRERVGEAIQHCEYQSEDEIRELNRRTGPIPKPGRLRMFISLFAIPPLGALLAACTPAPAEFKYPQECHRPYPELCVDTTDWDRAGSAYIVWQAPEGTVKNDIYLRNSLGDEQKNLVGIGSDRIIVLANPGIEDIQVMDITVRGAITLAVNPRQDHFLSVQACRAAEDCIPSEEIKIPKQH